MRSESHPLPGERNHLLAETEEYGLPRRRWRLAMTGTGGADRRCAAHVVSAGVRSLACPAAGTLLLTVGPAASRSHRSRQAGAILEISSLHPNGVPAANQRQRLRWGEEISEALPVADEAS